MRRVRSLACLLAVVWLAACAPEGPEAFVTYNIAPTADCVFSPDVSVAQMFYPIGLYDIAPGGMNGDGMACDNSYVVNLLVNSFLRPNSDMLRAEPDVLQLNTAQVLLTDNSGAVITFNRDKAALPNPFSVRTTSSLLPTMSMNPTTAVAAVEAIPKAYAPQLDGFVGKQIVAHIQIFATTTGNTDVNFKPFVYPIQICDGCSTLCATKIPAGKTRKDLITANTCDDNSGNDGRVCIDPSC